MAPRKDSTTERRLAASLRRKDEDFTAPAEGVHRKGSVQPHPTGERIWSQYQEDIFRFLATPGAGNLIIDAKAGSGKTTTIAEAFRRVNRTDGPAPTTAIFLAFNKSIASELVSRGVNARTFHSLCYGPVTKFKGARDVETMKLRKLMDRNFTYSQGRTYGAFAAKLVGLARQAGIGCLQDDLEQHWYALVEHHDLELEDERASYAEGVNLARRLLTLSNESDMIDFDDMLYVAVKEGLTLPKFDWVFVDEAQDTNAIQRAILRKILREPAVGKSTSSRLVAVGDPGQAIYGFRGADSQSMALITHEFSCQTLPLSVSYRCARAIVEHAREWVTDIQPAPSAPEGAVLEIGTYWDVNRVGSPSDHTVPKLAALLTPFSSGDLVVCRTSRPLLGLGYRFLKARIPVRILGREIGEGLVSLIEKMGEHYWQSPEGLDVLVDRLQAWRNRETEKALARQDDAKAEAVGDKADAILALVDSLAETERSVSALVGVIRQLFAEPGRDVPPPVTLSTIHKAKGLEADRVFWLNSSQCPAKWARQEWQHQQELNLCYVATTRAKSTLILIEEPR